MPNTGAGNGSGERTRFLSKCRHCQTAIPYAGRGQPRKTCLPCRDARQFGPRLPTVGLYGPDDVPFVPRNFDEAVERGRLMYGYGLKGITPPNDGFLMSKGDWATYNLGARHSREFASPPTDAVASRFRTAP